MSVQPCNTNTQLTWDTTGLSPGPYQIEVRARATTLLANHTYAIVTFWVGS
jgi:hypothetical protein